MNVCQGASSSGENIPDENSTSQSHKSDMYSVDALIMPTAKQESSFVLLSSRCSNKRATTLKIDALPLNRKASNLIKL